MTTQDLQLEQLRPMPRVLGGLRRVFADCGEWLRRSRQRRELIHMDALTLRDLGLSQADVWYEASKAPWQP